MVDKALVRIDGRIATEVRTFCRITGISISTVLDQAPTEFIERGGLLQPIENMHANIKRRMEENGTKVRLTTGERELLARYLPQRS
jgi:hypothetical protein